MTTPRPRVAVIYDGFPHYRKGVIEELAASDRYEYFFFGDPTYREPSIKAYEFAPGINVVRTRSFSLGPLYVQRRILGAILHNHISHCIFLGNPWFVSYWVLVPALRLLGRKVYFWSHGWIGAREPPVRTWVKHAYFRMADALLLYGERARRVGVAHGFRADRMHVIGNSLDYRTHKRVFDGLRVTSPLEIRRQLELPADRKIIVCTARVTLGCRFDLLFQAAATLRHLGREVFVLIVGDGPERESLSTLATSLGVAHRFLPACYDEAQLARLYKAADLTVSPGKVGLTAIHSMAYGTPVITHGNPDHQMPEHEAVVPGVTGDFFAENSSDDLARAIAHWFDSHPTKPEQACIERVEASFTPMFQRVMIEEALRGTP
jgi:glycosyltransferase involved in cell wall biosynthesis